MVVDESPYVIFDETCQISRREDIDIVIEIEKLNLESNKQPYMEFRLLSCP